MNRRWVRWAMACAVAWSCGRAPEVTPAPEPPVLGPPAATVGPLEIHQPSGALFPGMGAIYFSVVDTSTAGDRLLRVETHDADAIETHESIDDDGVMRMVAHPDGFAVPAGGTLTLAPGGKHIMLIGPRLADPQAGVRAELVFERAGRVTVVVPVSEPARDTGAVRQPEDSLKTGSRSTRRPEELNE